MLWDICQQCFKDANVDRLIYVVDTLNECEGLSRDQLLQWNKDYATSIPRSRTAFIFTSRPVTEIKDTLRDAAILLDLDHSVALDSQSKYIAQVVNHQICNMLALEMWPSLREEQLQRRLIENADKTFLWVTLVLYMLPSNLDASEDGFERMLTDMPDGLPEIYKGMLDAVPYRFVS